MPELPEVETVRRGLFPHLVGRRIEAAGGTPSPKFRDAQLAKGRTVTEVSRRGKYLLASLDDDRDLVFHLGMTGQLRVDTADAALGPHDRAWFELDNRTRLTLRDVRQFGRVAVVGADRSSLPTLAALGPEPLDPAFDGLALWMNLSRHRTRIKTTLLGQRAIAGVGNIYADEALWRAQINPSRRRLSRAAATDLHRAIVDVLTEGIENGGTTLRDYRTVDGGSGRNQHRLSCYGRGGEPCPRCQTILRSRPLDGRTTTWCPACQAR